MVSLLILETTSSILDVHFRIRGGWATLTYLVSLCVWTDIENTSIDMHTQVMVGYSVHLLTAASYWLSSVTDWEVSVG